ncbi:hypothetical protein [Micromonospora endolithica]|nr:hypothetical protein [Micromonospora endolithica]
MAELTLTIVQVSGRNPPRRPPGALRAGWGRRAAYLRGVGGA